MILSVRIRVQAARLYILPLRSGPVLPGVYFQPWPRWFVGSLGPMPEVKQEGEVFLEKNETTESPGPVKFLNADEEHFTPPVYFSVSFFSLS